MAVAETIWAEDMDEMLCRAFSLAFWSCRGNTATSGAGKHSHQLGRQGPIWWPKPFNQRNQGFPLLGFNEF